VANHQLKDVIQLTHDGIDKVCGPIEKQKAERSCKAHKSEAEIISPEGISSDSLGTTSMERT